MNLDELDNVWRTTNEVAATREQREQLYAAAGRRVERLWNRIVRRDFVETIAAVVLMFFFGRYFFTTEPEYIVSRWGAAFLVCWSLFIIYKLHRTRMVQRPTSPDAPVREFCRTELDRLDRQIGLLRGILWWYIVPCMAGVNVVFVGLAGIGILSLAYSIFTVLLAWGIYGLNQRAVARELVPPRNELANQLNEWGETVALIDQPPRPASKARGMIAAAGVLAALAAFGIATGGLVDGRSVDYPKRAPYSDIRWEQGKPVVKIGEEWFTLVSIDGIDVEKIISFSWWTYLDKWRKRFDEDLVEVLTRMGHPPGDTVTLVVQPLASSETRTLADVPMTEANRRSIYKSRDDRDGGEQEPKKTSTGPAEGAAAPVDGAAGPVDGAAVSAAASPAVRGVEIPPIDASTSAQVAEGPPGDASVPSDHAAQLADLVASLREKSRLVGLAALVMVDGKVVASAADGERKIGSGVSIEPGDRWHLGSITKSITATMIARLIESGRMTWSDTVGETFSDASIHEGWKQVTLRQLLTHTSSAPPDFSFWVRLEQPDAGPELTRARRKAVMGVIAAKPPRPAGEAFAYSNVGYTIAAAMAEKATGASWEDLVTREVFEPLELSGAGFGPPTSSDEALDQPRGHHILLSWKVAADDTADNTPIMRPAGGVHMTLDDLAKYALEHLRGEQGAGKLLSAETYKRLHSPERDDYACGWARNEPAYDIPHAVYWHNGSNTMWYALVAFIPGKNMVVAVASNDGDLDQAESVAWRIVNASAKRFNVADDAALRRSLPVDALPKKSPFSSVRWRDGLPEVRVERDWYQLVSLDGYSAGEIMNFCRSLDAARWQKRFEEDLVEVLVRMGHVPGDSVRLVVHPIGSSTTLTLEDVEMTKANRQAIRRAAKGR